MSLFEAVILGLVQGVTEFLPVSSTGHVVLVQEFLTLDTIHALAFGAVLNLAAAFAMVVYFWSDIWTLLQTLLRRLGRLPVNERDLTLTYALILGTIPAVLLGIIFESFILGALQQTAVVASVLFAAAVFLMYAEWCYYNRPVHESITPKRGLLVGLFQILALLPGFSRSGATIAGGMLLGMSRYEATRFSFLLAIPVTLGIGIKKLLDLIQAEGAIDWMLVGTGAVVAFVAALAVIHYFLLLMRKYTLWPFIWYSVVLATLVGYVSVIA